MKRLTFLFTVCARAGALFGIVAALLLGLGGCKKEGAEAPRPDTVATGTASLSGVVLDENKAPMAGVQVQAGTAIQTTDAAGSFSFASVPSTGGRCIVKATRDGYFTSVVGVRVGKAAARTQITLASMGPPIAFSATAGGVLDAGSGMKIGMPAGGITKEGAGYTGAAQAYVRYISPADDNLADLMPGGDMAAVDAAGAAKTLITYGAVRVELRTTDGAPLQLAAGKPATLRFPAGAATAAAILLWHFNETSGLWEEQGSATRSGSEYVGTVAHFSSWNLDHPASQAVVTGKLADCEGNPLRGIVVRVGQTQAVTDDAGAFGWTVPAGTPVTVETVWAGVHIEVPGVAPGQIHDLGTVGACLPAIKGRLVDSQGRPIAGVAQLTGVNRVAFSTMIAGTDGRFVLAGPAGAAGNFIANYYDGSYATRQVQLPASGRAPMDMGDVAPPTSPTNGGESHISFTLDGDGRAAERHDMRLTPGALDLIIANQFLHDQETLVSMSKYIAPLSNSVALFVPGVAAGTYVSGQNFVRGSSITFKMDNDMAHSIFYESTSDAQLSITITEYGPVGGRLKGTFSGQMRKRVGTGSLTQERVTVSAGSFDVPRSADQP